MRKAFHMFLATLQGKHRIFEPLSIDNREMFQAVLIKRGFNNCSWHVANIVPLQRYLQLTLFSQYHLLRIIITKRTGCLNFITDYGIT